MSTTRYGHLPVAAAVTLVCAALAAGQGRPFTAEVNVMAPGVGGVSGLLTDAVLENGCFSCYSTVPSRIAPAAGSLATAGEYACAAGTMQYVEIDTLVVVYPRYRRTWSDGRLAVTLSEANIETLKAEVAQAQHFLWRSSNLKCLMKTDWMVVDRVLTPAQLWEVSGKGRYMLAYWPIGGGSLEKDLRDAGIVDGQYSVVVAFYAFENSDGAVAAYAGISIGVNRGFLGNASYIPIPLYSGLDRDGILVHEYLHSLDSIFAASGNPGGNDMGHADRPPGFAYPADSSRHFWFLLSNVLDPRSWLALDPEWARLCTAPDSDDDGIPDAGELPITEESFGSSPTKSDTDGDGLSDLKEMTAVYYQELDSLNPDCDNDGLSDGNDVYPLFWCNDRVARSTPQIDGLIHAGEYTKVARPWTPSDGDSQVSAYVAWSDDLLYVAADVTDDAVQTWYKDPYWHFNDNFEIDIDTLQDGWTTGDQRNYRFYAVPTGAEGKPYVSGELGTIVPGDTSWRSIDVSPVTARYSVRQDGYSIEMAIPAAVLTAGDPNVADVCIGAGSSLRVTFSVRDHDDYADWPQFNVFSGQDKDTPAFVTLHFTE